MYVIYSIVLQYVSIKSSDQEKRDIFQVKQTNSMAIKSWVNNFWSRSGPSGLFINHEVRILSCVILMDYK